MGRILSVRRRDMETEVPTNLESGKSWVKPEDEYSVYEGKQVKLNPQTVSSRRFRQPKLMVGDFINNLMEDKPYTNYTYELLHDWYDRFEEDYKPLYIRAQQTPIDWKSKIGNSDVSTNFKCTHEIKIQKGDIVVREDGKLLLLNWSVQSHPNNQATQAAECNTWLTITRRVPETTDELGFVVTEATDKVIVDSLPSIHSEYQGRPDFSANQSQPGITGNHLLNISCQWNEQTKNVRMGDRCMIGVYTYLIENVNIEQVDMEGHWGIVTLQARREAGGEQVE